MSDPKLTAALETVARASVVARAVQADLARVKEITKDDRSPVTVADFAVQAIVSLDLNDKLDDVLIVGEEHARDLRNDDHSAVLEAVVAAVRTCIPDVTATQVLDAIDACDHDGSAAGYWTLDPVDGTKGFLRGQQYAIALGYINGGEVTLGVMGSPNLPGAHDKPLDVADPDGMIYFATRGGCAWGRSGKGGEPAQLHVADGDHLMRVCESVEAAHSKQDDTLRIVEHLGGAGEPARLDSQCKYAVVARGQADAYLRLPTRKGYVEKIWDHAAGSLIATEAGAVVTDITGAPLDFGHGPRLEMNHGIICAAPGFHGRVIEAIDHLGVGVPV